MNVAVIGTGGWGTALGVLLHGNGHKVALWGRLPEEVEPILAARENREFLPGVEIPKEIAVTLDAAEALRGAELVVLAVPSHGMRPICEKLKPFLSPGPPLVSVAKGIENETGARMSEVIAEVLDTDRIVVLSGPSHAEEVARGVPTAVVVAAKVPLLAATAQKAFMNERFRIYTHDDVTGVELGGALKNVIAIAAGIAVGVGLGHNSSAALITRGIAEISRLSVACGARRETLAGLSGMGDLVLTCTGSLSRNRTVGEALGKGRKLPEILESLGGKVAEGVRTTHAALGLARRHGLEMPITEQMQLILNEAKDPREAIRTLMLRPGKDEL